MPAGYSALPNPHSRPEDEMEAAFEASDDEDDNGLEASESHPLNPSRPSESGEDDDDGHHDVSHPLVHSLGGVAPPPSRPSNIRIFTAGPGTYDFENADYDFPPPGSPPRRDRALPNNDWGNSNGVVPNETAWRPRPQNEGSFGWVRRILPGRIGGRRQPRGAVGGGNGDGVFFNLSAKPTAPREPQDDPENGIYVQPEDAQKDAPPSYQSAQADAVPPYWETTIHAPSSLSPGMMIPGELPIDGLSTGTLFSFLWNMLVSISFQFVGFLLTYLLHTTHAAKLGARAGLGLTLVQYGFALKAGREDLNAGSGSNDASWAGWHAEESDPDPIPSFSSGADADAWFAGHPNATIIPTQQAAFWSSDSTTEYLAFLLMAIGWFILLNSLLGFWRIKRLEKSILASHEENPDRTPPVPVTSSGRGHARQSSFAVHFERTLGLRLPSLNMFQSGNSHMMHEYIFEEDYDQVQGRNGRPTADVVDTVDVEDISRSVPADHPERQRLIDELVASERRLQQDLRAAGLL